jgi:hypothetical protein
MVQEIAENAVGAGDWIKKTDAEVLAGARGNFLALAAFSVCGEINLRSLRPRPD